MKYLSYNSKRILQIKFMIKLIIHVKRKKSITLVHIGWMCMMMMMKNK